MQNSPYLAERETRRKLRNSATLLSMGVIIAYIALTIKAIAFIIFMVGGDYRLLNIIANAALVFVVGVFSYSYLATSNLPFSKYLWYALFAIISVLALLCCFQLI